MQSNTDDPTFIDGQNEETYQDINYSAIPSQNACEEVGGIWRLEEGIMVPLESLDYRCFERYTDVDQVCTDSDQCLGSCVPVDYLCVEFVNGQFVSENCAGRCTESWTAICTTVEDGQVVNYPCPI